ncbi:MAG: hypothetical protein HWE34_13895 [Methylocystaceae bacterium]|nr:hypothetical protein [Methylocystaceae bacterium]
MTSSINKIKGNIRTKLSKKLRDEYEGNLHDVRMGTFNIKTKKLGIVLFFHTDKMKEQAKTNGLITKIEQFCLNQLSQVEWEEFRTYGVQLICDSHENVVRTNGGNYLMYRR